MSEAAEVTSPSTGSISNENDASLMNAELVEKLKLLNYEAGFTRTK